MIHSGRVRTNAHDNVFHRLRHRIMWWFSSREHNGSRTPAHSLSLTDTITHVLILSHAHTHLISLGVQTWPLTSDLEHGRDKRSWDDEVRCDAIRYNYHQYRVEGEEIGLQSTNGCQRREAMRIEKKYTVLQSAVRLMLLSVIGPQRLH